MTLWADLPGRLGPEELVIQRPVAVVHPSRRPQRDRGGPREARQGQHQRAATGRLVEGPGHAHTRGGGGTAPRASNDRPFIATRFRPSCAVQRTFGASNTSKESPRVY